MQDSLLKTELGGWQDVNHLASIKRLLDTISSPATITNGDNIFIYANQAFLDYYKYKLADIIGVSPQILQPLKGSRESYRESFQVAITQHRPWSGFIQNIDSSQNQCAVYLCIIPLRPMPTMRAAGFLGISTPAGNEVKLIGDIFTLLINASELTSSDAPLQKLTHLLPKVPSRQNQILRLAELGYTSKTIAAALDITPSTVNVVRWKARQPVPAKKKRPG